MTRVQQGGIVSRQVSVFICYKKWLSGEKDGEAFKQKNIEAITLDKILKDDGRYSSWMDKDGLAAGIEWESEIYRQLLASDVLLVLVGPGTSESPWVRRELALAAAIGISIVPVGFDLSDDGMTAEMTALEIGHLQWVLTRNIDFSHGEALMAELHGDLQLAATRTTDRQRTTLDALWARRTEKKAKAPDNQRAASFELHAGDRVVGLHLASGDLARVRKIDVLVNSENDYMQMARFFESRTVSSMLRRRGAQVKDGRYQDTIQHELDGRLLERGRPVFAGEVFATSAGGPHSELTRINKARVILHVAAVEAVDSESKVIPYKQPGQIESCVRGTLEMLVELNRVDAIFSDHGSEQRAEQQRLADAGIGCLRSIIFPLFGTGQGGLPAVDVVDPMVDGITTFLTDAADDPDAVLDDIYLWVFTADDLEVVAAALKQKLA